MAKIDLSFNFGANVRKPKKGGKGKKAGGKANAWTAYTSGSKRRR
jgi:hypothetical protein